MSWDVYLMQIPDFIKSASELKDDYHSCLGPRSEILAALFQLMPDMEWIEEWDYGLLRTKEHSIEIYAGSKDDEIVGEIMLAVRGRQAPMSIIKQICDSGGWRAFDTSTGDFIDFESNSSEGFNHWRRYADSVIGQQSPSKKPGDS